MWGGWGGGTKQASQDYRREQREVREKSGGSQWDGSPPSSSSSSWRCEVRSPLFLRVEERVRVVLQGRRASYGNLLTVEAHVGQRIPILVEGIVFKSGGGGGGERKRKNNWREKGKKAKGRGGDELCPRTGGTLQRTGCHSVCVWPLEIGMRGLNCTARGGRNIQKCKMFL